MTFRNRLLAVALLLTGLMLPAAPAPAEVTVYPYDRAGFQFQLSEFTTYGFEASEGFAKGLIQQFANGLIRTYTSIGPLRHGVYIDTHPYEAGTQVLRNYELAGILPVPNASLRLEFTGPVYAAGFDVVDLSTAGASISVQIEGVDPPLSFALPESDGNRATEEFWGIISSDPITRLDIIDLRGGTSDRPEILDDLTISVVPEPRTAVLAVWGALSLAASVLTHAD